ncbi:MAG: hypothetical protein U0787_03310 [Polyangia bacterium]
MQYVEALLAHAEDHDDEEDPNKLLREGVVALAMTLELLITKEPHRTSMPIQVRLRQPSVDINFPNQRTGEEGELNAGSRQEPKSDQGCGCCHIS